MARKSKKPEKKQNYKGRGFLARLGPGLITGASDDDPSGIGTYSQAGAQLGFGIGWTMLLTYPLMAAIQEISARVGRVTGHGIAGNVCRNFPAPVMWSLIVLLFVANTINIAADLGAMRYGFSSADGAFYTWRRLLLSCAVRRAATPAVRHRSPATADPVRQCPAGIGGEHHGQQQPHQPREYGGIPEPRGTALAHDLS
jgi:hypothetical protein